MGRTALRLLLALAVAGCASGALRHVPERQPVGATLAADYRVAGDRLRVEIDTDGYRLEAAAIVTGDGRTVGAEAMEHPPARGPVSVGFGVGSARRSGSVGVGVGLGIGTTLGPPRPEGNTVAVFHLAEVGPAPWRLMLELLGVEPAILIVLPPD